MASDKKWGRYWKAIRTGAIERGLKRNGKLFSTIGSNSAKEALSGSKNNPSVAPF